MLFLGTAGWTIPKLYADLLPTAGTHLQRYAQRLRCCEINSCFHREHRPATWEKWAAAVPDDFRFAVKVPRTITHEGQLRAETAPLLSAFLEQTAALGAKRGPLLLQIPPKLAFDPRAAKRFFKMFRENYEGLAVFEPRHLSWFDPAAAALLTEFQIARVAADPALNAEAAQPGAWKGIVYYRLHGSPRRYYSSYSEEYLHELAKKLKRPSKTVDAWCIFDNTASGAALGNALQLSMEPSA